MAAHISTELVARIVTHAALTPDREVCGLLFGDGDAITAATPAANVAAQPDRAFEIDPQALFAAIRAERVGGPRLIGHYHSHPSGDPAPSLHDAAAALEAGRLWLIVAGPDVATFRAVPGGPIHAAFRAEPLLIAG